MLAFEQIHKQYGDRVILEDISATIQPGKITALVGTNGSGKSTLLSVLSRLISQDKGGVTLNSIPLADFKSSDLAKEMSILKQSNHMDLKLTVEDLVSFGRFPYSKGQLNKKDKEIIADAITMAELTEFKDQYIDELSGGQRQRAYLAMIIAQDTQTILLDEPLNNLDIKHSMQVMRTLRTLVDVMDKTVIIVLHEINFASHFADYVIAMKDKKIKYHLPTQEFINETKLKDIFGVDFDIIEHQDKKICNYFNSF